MLMLTKTSIPAITPRKPRMMASITASLSLRNANTVSSIKNGAHKAIENGHPRIPPTAKQNIPCAVFNPPLQFMNIDIPKNVVYMAKLDGRKEADAWNMPGLKIKAIIKKRAIRGFRMLFITRNICIWQMAQTNAKTYRMK
jgi:hypothetical protein